MTWQKSRKHQPTMSSNIRLLFYAAVIAGIAFLFTDARALDSTRHAVNVMWKIFHDADRKLPDEINELIANLSCDGGVRYSSELCSLLASSTGLLIGAHAADAHGRCLAAGGCPTARYPPLPPSSDPRA